MKKIYLLLIILALLLVGCGKQNISTDKDNRSSESKQKISTVGNKTDTIKLVVHNTADKIKWFKTVAKSYEEKYPDRKIKIEAVGGTAQNYCTKLQMMLKTDKSIDVIYEDSFMLKSGISSGLLAQMNELKNWDGWNEFYPALRESVTFDDNIYALPVSSDVRGLFYNTDIFRKAEIPVPWQPKNWQDIIDTCKAIKKNVPDVTPITLFLSKAMGEATSMNTLQMLLAGTNSLLYKDNKWNLSSKGMLDSLKFIQELVKYNLLPRMGILMNPQYNNIVQFDLAPKEQCGIILDGNWLAGGWFLKDKKTFEAYQLAKMPTETGQKPRYVTMSGGWILAVSKKSKNREAAVDFIKLALGKENLLQYALDINNVTVRKDVAEDPSYPENIKVPTAILEYAHFRPSNVEYPIVSNNIATAVESVITQTSTPEQAIETLKKSVERILGEKAILKEK